MHTSSQPDKNLYMCVCCVCVLCEWSVCVSGQYVVSVMFVVVCRWQCPLCYTAVSVGVVSVCEWSVCEWSVCGQCDVCCGV